MPAQPIRPEDIGALAAYSSLMVTAALLLAQFTGIGIMLYLASMPADYFWHCLLLFSVMATALALAMLGVKYGTPSSRIAGMLSIAGLLATLLNHFNVI